MSAQPAADLLDDTLTDDQYALADRIVLVLRTRPAETMWTPSAIAQRLRVDTAAVRAVLPWLARHLYVRTYGSGARMRYGCWTSGR